MKKTKEEINREFDRLQNINTKIKVGMFLENDFIKSLDETDFDDVKEIQVEREEEFGIANIDGKTQINFGFGSIEIDQDDFEEAVSRWHGLNKLVEELKEQEGDSNQD